MSSSYNVKDERVDYSNEVTTTDRIHAYVWVTKYRWVWISLILIAVFVGAFVGGYATGMAIHAGADDAVHPQDFNAQVSENIRGSIKANEIEEHLKLFTQSVHPSGSAAGEKLSKTLADVWRQSGYAVREYNYTNVYVQYPVSNKPNIVTVLDKSGNTKFVTVNNESYYSAYSAVGTYTGKLMYVNYGTASDFDTLTKELGPCPTGPLVAIARLGTRRTILNNAEKWCRASPSSAPSIGALLLYADPADYAPDASKVWPNGPYIRGNDVLFGGVYGGTGDPLSSGLPSIEGVYRDVESTARATELLVQPISHDDALGLMKNLTGKTPANWKGGLNVAYNTGPGYSGDAADWNVMVTVSSDDSQRLKTMKNVVAVLRGQVEPDRYVIVGAHYDSWTFGASDPSGASSILSRMAIAFRNRANQGWTPRRSIIFAHWDGEQFRKIGSQEFTDQFGPEIQKRTVAYINLDQAINGLYSFQARGHPLLANVVYEATKQVPFPQEKDTVYGVWKSRSTLNVLSQPPVDPVGVSSDVWSFWNQHGVPYLYPSFRAQGKSAPFRYTLLDTYEMVNKYLDPGMQFHEVLARIVSDTVLRLSDSAILPYSFVSFSETLRKQFNNTVNTHTSLIDADTRVFVNHVQSAITDFVAAAHEFETSISQLSVNLISEQNIRLLNDRIHSAPQVFSTNYNLEYRKVVSLLYGSDYSDDSAVLYFPGVRNALLDLDAAGNQALGRVMIKKELSALMVAFQQATGIIRQKTIVD